MQRRIAATDDIELQCLQQGEGPPVLLLHGFANSAAVNWRVPRFLQHLARTFHVIAVDMRGHGSSSAPVLPQAYGLELVQDVARVLDRLGVERAHLVGISLGGFVALKAASVIPDRLRSVVILGAGWMDIEDRSFADALSGAAGTLERGQGIAPLAVLLGGDRPSTTIWHRALVWILTRFFARKLALAAMIRALPVLALSKQEVARIKTPVAVIAGSRDTFIVEARALARALPRAELSVIEGAGHIDLILRPRVRALVAEFLRRHENPARSG